MACCGKKSRKTTPLTKAKDGGNFMVYCPTCTEALQDPGGMLIPVHLVAVCVPKSTRDFWIAQGYEVTSDSC
jgi:hypothetical protein